MPAPSGQSSFQSSTASRRSSTRVERHRWLIQRKTGEFLASIKDGKPVWVVHPLDSLTHATMETASHNLHKMREFYGVDEIRLEPIIFYAYPDAPTQWFTDYD